MTQKSLPADMAKVAAEYLNSISHQASIDDYKDSILLLKAGSVSYEKIAKLLNAHHIRVSAATIRKFCINHEEEIARLRLELAAEAQAKASESVSLPAPNESRPPLTSDPGKRGPRPARDQL